MDKIIILTAILTFISLFGVIGYILLKIGAKNASKISHKIIEIHDNRFIDVTDLNNAAFDLLDEAKKSSKVGKRIVMYIEVEP